MPKKTTVTAKHRSTLLSSSAVSRLTGSNSAPPSSFGARQANRGSAPPMATPSIRRMTSPRSGALAKACTDASTPERTRNVPIRLNEKAAMASSSDQVRNAPVRSVASAECSSAVATSQGIRAAFSTGSQNQKPPQPST